MGWRLSSRSNLPGQFQGNVLEAIILNTWSVPLLFWTKKIIRLLVLPGGIVLLVAAVLAYSGWLTLPVPALTFISYAGLLGGMFLSWRFHSSRSFFCLALLLIVHAVIPSSLLSHHLLSPATVGAVRAIAFLVPVNYVLISLMEERGLTLASFAPVGVFWLVQSVVVAVLWRSADSALISTERVRHAPAVLLPGYISLLFAAALLALVTRFLFTRKALDSSFLWSLMAFYISVRNSASVTASELFLAAAAYVIVFSIIENSYLLAYHDELTGLPSRRAFNDATLRLQAPYSLAVVDIDHFKSFNDTYGHDVGDQVLRLVAAKLAGVTGGGQSFRCGGEEFTVLFPGKTLPEVTGHLEELRQTIEFAEFRMRGHDRRQQPRGQDRRKGRPGSPKRTRKGASLRLAEQRDATSLSVTVSIGIAASESDSSGPQLVMEAADKALYRAKENGRNRVEIASAQRRSKARTAGIA
jgi:GGDEF domain-containing protein